MMLLYWLVGELEALSTTGYLYSRRAHSFIGLEGDALSIYAQPERFTIRTSGGSVQILANHVGDDKNGSVCNGYRIEMNKTGEVRIRQGHRCEAVVSGYLEGRRCSGNKNQRFVWIPASLLEGSGWQGKTKHFPSRGRRPHHKHRNHPRRPTGHKHGHSQYYKHARRGYSDPSDHPFVPAGRIEKNRRLEHSDPCNDSLMPTNRPEKRRAKHGHPDSCDNDQLVSLARARKCRRSKGHHYGDSSDNYQPVLITKPEKYHRKKKPNGHALGQDRPGQKHEISSSSLDNEELTAQSKSLALRQPAGQQNTSQALDIYARIFCLQHPDIKECIYFNRIKAEEDIKKRIKLSKVDSSEDAESTSDPNATSAKIDVQPRIRGYFASGVDYDDGCSCDDECIRNPKNGQCYYRMDDDGNLAPMVKPCRCGNGNDMCMLPNVIDKFFCELAFLNDYTYFSQVLDSGNKASQ